MDENKIRKNAPMDFGALICEKSSRLIRRNCRLELISINQHAAFVAVGAQTVLWWKQAMM